MKYESCSGQCYDHSDVMRIHTLSLDVDGAVTFLKRLLAMHAPACGNANLAFRLDADDELGVFVASFERYGSLDLFAAKAPLEAMNKLIDGALAWYQSPEGRRLLGEFPMTNRESVCHHGTDVKLVEFAVRFSGLPDDDQAALLAQFR